MAFGSFVSPSIPSSATMVGTQTPQTLFGDIPAANAQIPGMVTPNTTVAMPSYVDWGDIANALAVQQKLKDASADKWARAAAINNARAAQNNQGWNTGGSTSAAEPSVNQTSGMGAQYAPRPQGSVLWAPRNLKGPQLGTWTEQQQKKAMAENKRPPVVLQAYADDPYSPGEVGGGGVSANVLGRGISGPGLTSPLGTANPSIWDRMWSRRSGQTTQGSAASPYSEEARKRMNRMAQQRDQESSGPQYQYDTLYRG